MFGLTFEGICFGYYCIIILGGNWLKEMTEVLTACLRSLVRFFFFFLNKCADFLCHGGELPSVRLHSYI